MADPKQHMQAVDMQASGFALMVAVAVYGPLLVAMSLEQGRSGNAVIVGSVFAGVFALSLWLFTKGARLERENR